ncbi:MAG: type VII secretion AAA-ATPase EccA, partial [Rhodococcus sp. (in: high G+C Gram-positive bacteria)]
MENNRDRVVVIVAGYEDAMNTFLDRNDGLKSRFARQIRFPSYRPADLVTIADTMATETYRAELTDSAAREVLRVAEYLPTEPEDRADGRTRTLIDREGNARFARNLIEAAIEEREGRP